MENVDRYIIKYFYNNKLIGYHNSYGESRGYVYTRIYAGYNKTYIKKYNSERGAKIGNGSGYFLYSNELIINTDDSKPIRLSFEHNFVPEIKGKGYGLEKNKLHKEICKLSDTNNDKIDLSEVIEIMNRYDNHLEELSNKNESVDIYKKDQKYDIIFADKDGKDNSFKYTPDEDMTKPKMIMKCKEANKNFVKLKEIKLLKESKSMENIKTIADAKNAGYDFDIGDNTIDMMVYFDYDPESEDSFDKCLKFIAENTKVISASDDNDYLVVDLYGFVKDHLDAFTSNFNLEETSDMSATIVENIMESLIAGNATNSVYTDLYNSFTNETKKEESVLNESSNTDRAVIHTGFNDEKTLEILESVIGQLSDGIWENNSSMDRYWKYMHADRQGSEVVMLVDNTSWRSGFCDKSEQEIAKYIATKIKQVVKEEGLDWTRDNDEVSGYLDRGSGVTVKDAYRVYDRLLGRKDRITVEESKADKELNESKKYNIYTDAIACNILGAISNYIHDDDVPGLLEDFEITEGMYEGDEDIPEACLKTIIDGGLDWLAYHLQDEDYNRVIEYDLDLPEEALEDYLIDLDEDILEENKEPETVEEIKARIKEINDDLAYCRRRNRVCLALDGDIEEYELTQEREELRNKLKQIQKASKKSEGVTLEEGKINYLDEIKNMIETAQYNMGLDEFYNFLDELKDYVDIKHRDNEPV